MTGRAEEEQHATPERLSAEIGRSTLLLDCLPYPVAYLDLEGRFLYASADFARPSGSPDALVGQTFADWFDPAARTLIRDFLEDCRLVRAPGMAIPDDPKPTVQVPGSTDVVCEHFPDLAFRLYPLRSTGEPLGAMVVLLPLGVVTGGVPSLATRDMRHRQRLAALLEVSRSISSSLERDVILQNIVDRVQEVVTAPEVVLFQMEADGETIVPMVAKVESFYEEVMAVRLRLGEGIVGWVAKTGRAEIVNHAEHDPRSIQVPGTPLEQSALLCVPLLIKGRLAGVLALTRLGGAGFEPDDLEVVTVFAAHCSVAIENAQLYEDRQRTVEELQSAQSRLIESAKLNALGQMAGGVAHDFNNVLTAILGRTQLLLRWIDHPEYRQALQVVERTALEGAHTVRRLQEFTRVRHDEAALRVDLNEVALQVVELIRPTCEFQSRGRGTVITIETDLRSRSEILGAESDLREAVWSLAQNAIEAMPEGGRVLLRTEDRADRVRIIVADTGVGMDEATRGRMFEPFFSTKPDKATGLGLSVAYGIVHRHHGELEVESRPGQGSIFTLDFPAAPESAEDGARENGEREVRRMRILCVDDETAVLEVLAELLEATGHEVARAHGGKDGLELARKIRPEIVFTDLGMPEVDGWQVAETVKRSDPRTSVVLVTGWGVQIDNNTASAKGVDYVLPKPFTIEEIERALSILAEKRKAA